jgi:hypothetical protein
MLMREAHFDPAQLVEPLDLLRAEMGMQSAQVIFQLLELARAQEDPFWRRLRRGPGARINVLRSLPTCCARVD